MRMEGEISRSDTIPSSDAWPVALNGRTIDFSFAIFWLEGVNVSGGVSAYLSRRGC